MDKLQQKVNKIKEDLAFSMLKIKKDVKNYQNIHLVKHEEGLDDNCSKRIKRSNDRAENLYSSLEEAVNELHEEMASNWEAVKILGKVEGDHWQGKVTLGGEGEWRPWRLRGLGP